MNLLKNKKNGYILLLTMIITSSIFLLVISVIVKNRLCNTVAKTISIKHEQEILFVNGISIIKSLLSFDELKKNNNKNNQNNKKKEKEDNDDNINLLELFFNFYWNNCNKWLKFNFNNNSIPGIISIYLTVEDGKYPLKNIFAEYIKVKALKEKNNTEQENQKTINIKTDSKNNQNTNIEENKEINNNLFIKETKKWFKELEEKNHLFNNNFNNKNNNNPITEKDSLILKMIDNYFKKGNKKEPISLDHLFYNLNNEILYGNINNNPNIKNFNYGLYNIFSIFNNKCSLFFLSPELIEFITKNKIELNKEKRKKIIEKGKKYLQKINNQISINDLWKDLYENNLQIPSSNKNYFFINEIKKIYSTELELPSYLSALIKIEIMNTFLFGLVHFEKNKKYANTNNKENYQNQEYLIKSLYILPF